MSPKHAIPFVIACMVPPTVFLCVGDAQQPLHEKGCEVLPSMVHLGSENTDEKYPNFDHH